MLETFVDWIEQERAARNWSIRQLAKASELSSGTVTDVLSGRARPGTKFCVGIARAFNKPADEVCAMGGVIPSTPDPSPQIKELVHLANQLTESEVDRLLAIARTLYERQAQQR